METSKQGIDFLKKLEADIPYLYLCEANRKTIGVGITLENLTQKDIDQCSLVPISEIKIVGGVKPCVYKDGKTLVLGESMRDCLLKKVVKHYEKAVNDAIQVSISQPQFDALLALCYNIGVTSFSNSASAVKAINRKKPSEYVASRWILWNKVTVNNQKIFSKGLDRRRKKEIALFTTGNYEA